MMLESEQRKPRLRKDLFRVNVVIDDNDRAWSGEAIASTPISFLYASLASVVILLLIIFFLNILNYSKKVDVVGQIKSDKGLAKVFSDRVGVIDEIYISEGDVVKEGDVLLKIVPSGEEIDGPVYENVIAKIQDQIALHEKAFYFARSNLERKKSEISENIDSYTDLISSGKNKLKYQKEKVKTYQSELDDIKKLVSNNQMAKISINEKKEQIIDAQLNLIGMEERLNELSTKLKIMSLEKADIEKNIAEELNRTNLLKSQLNQKIVELESSEAFMVKASASGVVSAVLVERASAIQGGNELLSIIPSGSQWLAEIYAPSAAIGNVNVGQNINLKYSAFPYQKYGIYRAEVSNISKTILSPRSIPEVLRIEDSSYRIIAELKDQHVNYLGEEFNLQSGMQFSAELVIEKRSLIGWFMGPIYDIANRF